ncbi:MAG: zinc-binding dehydrogenase, partial [Alphaproteobacteria bacterium]|nr:zinc-binding dehydrogenase [Alphaproteobacteria bacterium]
AGERVLVLGAGGGMGLAAVAIAAALGAEVVAAAASDDKLAAAKAAGAAQLLKVDRAAPDFAAIKDSIDIVFDPLGGPFLMPALRALRWGGRHLVVGFVAGHSDPVPPNRLLIKGLELIGVRAGETGRQDPVLGRAARDAIDGLAEKGMRPHIGASVALERADELFAAMAAGRLVGKAVATIG